MKKVLLITVSMIVWLTLNLISLAYFPSLIIISLLIVSIVIEIWIIEKVLHMNDFKTRSLFTK